MLYKIVSLLGDLSQKTTTLCYTQLEENAGIWQVQLVQSKTFEIGFTSTINHILQMNIVAYHDLEMQVSKKLVQEINVFIHENALEHKIDFISLAGLRINDTFYLGNAAIIAATIELPIISNFHQMNTALDGNNNIFAIANDFLQIDVTANAENKGIALALLGALRWREANNILQKDTNATKNHIAGGIWLGVEA
jgi:hypothetical protein